MMRSGVDRPGVKPLCCGRCFAKIVRVCGRKPWPEQIEVIWAQSDFRHFPFPSGIIMARFLSLGRHSISR